MKDACLCIFLTEYCFQLFGLSRNLRWTVGPLSGGHRVGVADAQGLFYGLVMLS